jgi:hypothetical protein
MFPGPQDTKTAPSGRRKHANALRRKRNRLKARLNALVNNGAPDVHIRNVKNKVALLSVLNTSISFRVSCFPDKVLTVPVNLYGTAASHLVIVASCPDMTTSLMILRIR